MALTEWFAALSAGAVLAFIEDSQEEHFQLDFKLLKSEELKSEDDKSNLAKALSGFANASGGVIVWGVNARRVEGVDCACGAVELENIPLTLSRLNQLTAYAVSPSVDGVVHKPLPTGDNRGFIATLVPESSGGPHMAKLKLDRYYKRSGDSFLKMEHYEVADMFGRRPKSSLLVAFHNMGEAIGISGEAQVGLMVSIENRGRGSARAPFLSLQLPRSCQLYPHGIDGNGRFGLSQIPVRGGGKERKFGADASFVLHPGVSHDVCQLIIPAHHRSELVIPYLVASEDAEMYQNALIVDYADGLTFYFPKG